MEKSDLNLIASCALFRNLYDQQKDIYDVIAEYIRTIIYLESKFKFTSSDISDILNKKYGFKLPEAVIRTTLSNRLKKTGEVSSENGFYNLININENRSKELSDLFDRSRNEQEDLFKILIKYIESKLKRKILEAEKDNFCKSFNDFIIGSTVSEQETKLFSGFILKYNNNEFVTKNLNRIKEGYVLYQGICYSSDLNSLGSWNEELTILLDTEHLLNSSGYNGILYSDIFNDFMNLVTEINSFSQRKNNGEIIKLRYFEETKQEIDSLFFVAEEIISGQRANNPSKSAMSKIIENCKSRSDIVTKKTGFFHKLRSKGILPMEEIDYYKNHSLNIESVESVKLLNESLRKSGKNFDEAECHLFLKLFTKINVLRNGANENGFEKMRYIFLTANHFALAMAFNDSIRTSQRMVTFATNIEYITNRFWFKLKKGFGGTHQTPKIFNIIANSQMLLASQIKISIADEFTSLADKYEKGEITKEHAIALNIDLRDYNKSPEEIKGDNVENILAFLNKDESERYYKDKLYWKNRAEIGDRSIKKLWQIKKNKIKYLRKQEKRIYRLLLSASYCLMALLIALPFLLTYSLLMILKSESDTPIALISFLITSLSILYPLIKFKSITKRVRFFSKDSFIREFHRELKI
ncbi:hypothetical protein CH371_13135 [Leptospira wolffii]|uniref:Uncharacterized protein n=1 Tax=Leptospira wolffii TaxID=409998 RepID=A0A2M9ZA67_9LEPT|nr:hypothetical protein [Leptospira wolffii]PJZ65336.1 hypothetical protein CH371_13135 [Leptospira wolffii]